MLCQCDIVMHSVKVCIVQCRTILLSLPFQRIKGTCKKIFLSTVVMKVVALVSGGKDSCYNMVKCVQNGHEIVCIANLAPQDKQVRTFLKGFAEL